MDRKLVYQGPTQFWSTYGSSRSKDIALLIQCDFCAFSCSAIFRPFESAEIAPDHTKSKVWKNTPHQIAWCYGAMQAGGRKCTAFMIYVWGIINKVLAPAANCKGTVKRTFPALRSALNHPLRCFEKHSLKTQTVLPVRDFYLCVFTTNMLCLF